MNSLTGSRGERLEVQSPTANDAKKFMYAFWDHIDQDAAPISFENN